VASISRSHSTRSIIERTLDDAIARLCLADSTIESRTLLADARRLKGLLVGWRTAPPEAESRREMLAQVMKLANVVSAMAPTTPVNAPFDPIVLPPPEAFVTPPEGMRRVSPMPHRSPRMARPSSSSSMKAVAPGWRVLEVALAPGVALLRASTTEWRPYALLAGASVRLLHRDAGGGGYTAVVKMNAGTELPRHRHASAEEMYLIEGALEIGGVEAIAGDYCRAEPGSIHEVIKTASGCTFLLVGSERDEILPPESGTR
jgi:quercetin dioxygenase-like cupin family protein